MTTVLDRVTDVQDQVISAITSIKDPVTNAVAVVVDFVLERAPEVPAVPFAEQIPTPKELIDNQAKFASKLVSTNKSVALSVASAAKPLTDQLLDRKSGPARSTKAAA
jgi:hypothetical protein